MCGVHGRTCREVCHIPAAGRAYLSPAEVDAVGRGIVGCEIQHLGACRHGFDGDVVDNHGVVACSRLRGLKGDAAMGPVVEREGYGVLLVGGGGVGLHICHGDEGAGIVGVGHHAHHDVRQVGGGCGTHPEGHLQVGQREECGVDGGHDGNLVGVGAEGGIGVETHRVGTAMGVR